MNHSDPQFQEFVQRLHRLSVYGRWLFVLCSWLILGSFGVWGLRKDISLWMDYFTWTAVRYAFHYNQISTLCISFCIAITAAVLVWQSNNLLRGGIAPREKRRLEKQVDRILALGPKHHLWKWVCYPSNNLKK